MTEAAESARIREAHGRALARRERQRGRLRPLAWVLIAVVAVGTANGRPQPGLHGADAGITVALVVYLVTIAVAMAPRFAELPGPAQLAMAGVVGASGIALAALQPHGQPELAGSAAVWLAVTRLPLRPALALAGVTTAGLIVALGARGSGATSTVAIALLCILLALTAHLMKQSRESQDRAELLLAELEDARDEQARAAAVAERGRIAGELHDVLAHSLSGAAIQLEAARLLAERQEADPRVRDAIARAGELVRDGLGDARRAVGALRGEELPTAEEIGSLVQSFRADVHAEASLRIDGEPRSLPADVGLALFRGAQEALTNVARYAPGATVAVTLNYATGETRLTVENTAGNGTAHADHGSGRGLTGMRERVQRAGGTMSAGPIADGWRVTLSVPG